MDSAATTVAADVGNTKHSDMTEWKPSRHERFIFYTLSVICLVIALDATVIVTALSSIIQDIGGTSTQAFWVGTSYLISCAVVMPFLASLSDIFGRPIILISSLIVFTAGTIVCCAAQTITQLLAGRVLQGVGGGGMYILTVVILTDVVPLRFRTKYYGVVQGGWAVGTLTGPIIGGGIARNTTWRWIYYLNFPILAFALVAVPMLLTLKPRTATLGEKLSRVDWIGGFFFMGSTLSFLIAVSWGGSQNAWNSAQTLAPLLIGIVGIIGSLCYEAFVAKEPFFRRSLFTHTGRSATIVYFLGFALGFVMYAGLYYIPFYYLSVKDYDPLISGAAMLPVLITILPGSIISGILVSRLNNYRWPIWFGWLIITVACGLLVYWGVGTSIGVCIITLFMMGVGFGSVLNAQTFCTGAMCLPDESGHAAGMALFARTIGSAIGVGVGTTAFQNVMAMKLGWLGLPVEIARDSEAYLELLRILPADDFKASVLESYSFGFKGVFGVLCGLSGVAFFLSLLIRHYDLNQKLDSKHTLHDNRVSKVFQGTP